VTLYSNEHSIGKTENIRHQKSNSKMHPRADDAWFYQLFE